MELGTLCIFPICIHQSTFINLKSVDPYLSGIANQLESHFPHIHACKDPSHSLINGFVYSYLVILFHLHTVNILNVSYYLTIERDLVQVCLRSKDQVLYSAAHKNTGIPCFAECKMSPQSANNMQAAIDERQ